MTQSRSLNFLAISIIFLFALIATPSYSQTLTTITNFSMAAASNPGPLVQGFDGDFYGVTSSGSQYSRGTIFKVTPSGTLTILYTFCSQINCPDGDQPIGSLLQTPEGYFYGVTSIGGANGQGGTIFRISPQGEFTTLYSFCSQPNCADGNAPSEGLMQATNGALYGTTEGGGVGGSNSGGTIFRITPQGVFTSLYSLNFFVDGAQPIGKLFQSGDGLIFGSTLYGPGDLFGKTTGTIFNITDAGVFATVYKFCRQAGCPDGSAPCGGLTQLPNGNFFGTTLGGGAGGYGTIFKMTPLDQLTTILSFDLTDGYYPDLQAPLLSATDNNLYGTTPEGGSNYGTLFRITPGGKLTTLYNFCTQPNCLDGAFASSGVIQSTSGKFYGTTTQGGTEADAGTVFTFDNGLSPFIEAVSISRKIGAAVVILGNNLSEASGVQFNGTPASFTVVSDTQIRTTVPHGATSGFVTVTTPAGSLSSNQSFNVRP